CRCVAESCVVQDGYFCRGRFDKSARIVNHVGGFATSAAAPHRAITPGQTARLSARMQCWDHPKSGAATEMGHFQKARNGPLHRAYPSRGTSTPTPKPSR